jgi:hypothetical protein
MQERMEEHPPFCVAHSLMSRQVIQEEDDESCNPAGQEEGRQDPSYS